MIMRIIDKLTGLFVRDDFTFDGKTEIGLDVKPPSNLYQPKWDGQKWIESMAAAEIAILESVKLTAAAEIAKVEKRASAEREATKISMGKLVNTDTLTPEEVQKVVWLFDEWKPDYGAVAVGDLLIYNDKLYKVIQAHTTQADWTPDIVPALFKPTVPEGVIPDWVQPAGAQDAYNIGDKVLFGGKTYESTINANVWSPTVYPAGWKLI